MSQTLSGLGESTIFTSKKCKRAMKHNLLCTCEYKFTNECDLCACVCVCLVIFGETSKKCKGLFFFFFPICILRFFGGKKTVRISFDVLKHPAHLELKWIKYPRSFPVCRLAQIKSGAPKKKLLPYFIQTNDIINKVEAHLNEAR